MTSRSVIRTNSLARQLFSLLRDKAKLKLEKEPIEKAIKALDDQIEPLKEQLYTHILNKWDELFVGPLKSFATYYAAVSWRSVPTKLKVNDQLAAIEVARVQGILGEVGVVVIAPDRLEAFLVDHPEFTELFGESITPASQYKSVSIKRNAKFVTKFDPTQLTPESVKLNS